MMDFTEAQQNYKDLSKSYFGGQLSMADFHREVRSLQITDERGRRWRINSHSGKWQAMQDGVWRDANPTDSPSPREQRAQVKLSAIPTHSHSETRFSLEVALAFALVLGVIIGSVVIIVLTLNPIR